MPCLAGTVFCIVLFRDGHGKNLKRVEDGKVWPDILGMISFVATRFQTFVNFAVCLRWMRFWWLLQMSIGIVDGDLVNKRREENGRWALLPKGSCFPFWFSFFLFLITSYGVKRWGNAWWIMVGWWGLSLSARLWAHGEEMSIAWWKLNILDRRIRKNVTSL